MEYRRIRPALRFTDLAKSSDDIFMKNGPLVSDIRTFKTIFHVFIDFMHTGMALGEYTCKTGTSNSRRPVIILRRAFYYFLILFFFLSDLLNPFQAFCTASSYGGANTFYFFITFFFFLPFYSGPFGRHRGRSNYYYFVPNPATN